MVSQPCHHSSFLSPLSAHVSASTVRPTFLSSSVILALTVLSDTRSKDALQTYLLSMLQVPICHHHGRGDASQCTFVI